MDNGKVGNWLTSMGNQLVDPNGAVTGMMGADESLEQERIRRMREAQELARQKSLMEAAAATPTAPVEGPKALAPYNPFVILFGQPNDPNSKGLLGR